MRTAFRAPKENAIRAVPGPGAVRGSRIAQPDSGGSHSSARMIFTEETMHHWEGRRAQPLGAYYGYRTEAG